MQKYILSKDALSEILYLHTVPLDKVHNSGVAPSEMLYQTSEAVVPVTIPGGLLGDLAVIFSTAEQYGLEVDESKTWEILSALSVQPTVSTPFINHIITHPDTLSLTPSHSLFLSKMAKSFKSPHSEPQYPNGAVLIVKGDNALTLPIQAKVEGREIIVYPFVFHHTLVNTWHRNVCEKLIEANAITLLEGQETEYLYEVISDTTDTFLFEDMNYSAPQLPIYSITYLPEEVKIEDLS